MKETALWTQLKGPLQSFGHMQKHSDRFTVGIPDSDFCFPPGAAGWMEFKELKGKQVIRTRFRKGQVPWGIKYTEAGGKLYLLSSYSENRTRILVMMHDFRTTWEMYEKGAPLDTFKEAALVRMYNSQGWGAIAQSIVLQTVTQARGVFIGHKPNR